MFPPRDHALSSPHTKRRNVYFVSFFGGGASVFFAFFGEAGAFLGAATFFAPSLGTAFLVAVVVVVTAFFFLGAAAAVFLGAVAAFFLGAATFLGAVAFFLGEALVLVVVAFLATAAFFGLAFGFAFFASAESL